MVPVDLNATSGKWNRYRFAHRPVWRIFVTPIQDICNFLDQYAPTRLAEDWDNVGLLAGDPAEPAAKIMTCLTVTPASAAEAIERGASMIVSHHPLPFRATKRLTTDAIPTRMLWQLIRAGVAIYSPHTGFDSASSGINNMLAERLSLTDVKPLKPFPDDPDGLGAGRVGRLESGTLAELVETCKQQFGLSGLHLVGSLTNNVRKVAIACGSGGSFLAQARFIKCDTFVTGEATFHTSLEAESSGINLVLLGHYSSERFAVEVMAEKIQEAFSGVEVWASEKESDPLQWV